MIDRHHAELVAPSSDGSASDRPCESRSVAGRREYVTPRLIPLGSVRDLTLGNSGKSHDVTTHTKR
jgi:hypothetical protein